MSDKKPQPIEPYVEKQLFDKSAEMCLLGCMIFENDTIADVLDIVKTSEMFIFTEHQTIFDTIIEMFNESKKIDLVTLRAELIRKNLHKKIRPTDGEASAYLHDLVQGVPSTATVRQYATIVNEKYVLRNIMAACKKVIQHTVTENEDVEEVRFEAEKALFEALAKVEKAKIRSMMDVMKDVFNGIEDIRDRKSRIRGLATGFYEIDDMTSGLQKKQLYIVAGRPSMGKTSLGMNIAENVALREQKSVLVFSLEMGAELLAKSMLCSHARVDSQSLNRGTVSDEEYQKLLMAAGAFADAKLFVDDCSDLSGLEMRTKARRMKALEGVDLVIVDYLQKMNARQSKKGPESRQVEISEISHNLKSMAKELDIPVIAMAQLNRGPEGRDDKKPLLSDLRESGSIEQDADVVMLLFREEYYDTETEKKGVAEVHIAKNRTGPTGTVDLAFLKQFTRFENLAAAPQGYQQM